MTVAIVGELSAEQCEHMRHALLRADLTAQFYRNAQQARLALDDSRKPVPRCVFLDSRMAGAAGFAHWMRGQMRLFSVPLFVLAPTPLEQYFAEAHAYGADDVVLYDDLGALTRRGAWVAGFDPQARPPATLGCVLVAHPEDVRRRLVGRIFRQAGFDVRFAAGAGELGEGAASGHAPKIVFLGSQLPPDGAAAAVELCRRAVGNSELPVVVLAPEHELREQYRRLSGFSTVEVACEEEPPDHLLFIANELLRPGVDELRASARLLHGTLCAFRPAGELQPVYGFTYNLSHRGLYVKSFDPPRQGSRLWLELRPPGAMHAVHLRGEVMWVRTPSHERASTTPAGFGLKIDAEACPPADLAAYERHYQELVEQRELLRRPEAA